jgi:hypothetical protein
VFANLYRKGWKFNNPNRGRDVAYFPAVLNGWARGQVAWLGSAF